MQEVRYELPNGNTETIREFFSASTQEECFDKMRARFAAIEREVKVVGMDRTKLTRSQMKRMKRKAAGKCAK